MGSDLFVKSPFCASYQQYISMRCWQSFSVILSHRICVGDLLAQAARWGRPAMCEMLLQAGANANAYVYFEQSLDFENKIQRIVGVRGRPIDMARDERTRQVIAAFGGLSSKDLLHDGDDLP
eukprot:3726552-Pyramimonas_sp.AAC.1